ncbi:hypothetical protein EDD85DRAFT_956130 [Armillaria nabsnona]|nr:hypothetical protein EDD85DRAFT_956130 [Armillaria nabsnona]
MHQSTLPPPSREEFHGGNGRTQGSPGASLARQNGMTEDIGSVEINEEMKHPTLGESADKTEAQDQDDSRFWAVLIGVDGDLRYPLHGCVSDAELSPDGEISHRGPRYSQRSHPASFESHREGDHRRFYKSYLC